MKLEINLTQSQKDSVVVQVMQRSIENDLYDIAGDDTRFENEYDISTHLRVLRYFMASADFEEYVDENEVNIWR